MPPAILTMKNNTLPPPPPAPPPPPPSASEPIAAPPARPAAVPFTANVKISAPLSIRLTTQTQLGLWAKRLAAINPQAKPNNGSIVTEMMRVLLDAGWVPGDIVAVRKGRK